MEEHLHLKKEIAKMEHELALLKSLLQHICPHANITHTEYIDDDWAQNAECMLVFRCEDCGRTARMTRREYQASGNTPFSDVNA